MARSRLNNDSDFRKYVKMDTAYMPMPEHCGRGARPVFDGVRHVDLVICYFFCTEPGECKEYQQYLRDLKNQKRNGNKKPGRKVLDL